MEKPNLGIHVFIAEDEELISNLYRLQLERVGYLVTTAEDGQKAIDMLKSMNVKPDLLLLDLGLPVFNGHEVYEAAVKKFGYIPTIFCSGNYSETINTTWLSEHPKTSLLIKPVSIKTIIEVIKKFLNP